MTEHMTGQRTSGWMPMHNSSSGNLDERVARLVWSRLRMMTDLARLGRAECAFTILLHTIMIAQSLGISC